MKSHRKLPAAFSLFSFRMCQFTTILITRLLFFNISITGRENIPQNGAYIIVSNHIGHLDPYLFTNIFSRQLYYMARPNALSLRLLGGVDATDSIFTTGPAAVKEAIKRIMNGKILVFFPEGERNEYKHVIAPKAGAAYVALKTKARIVPVKITGTDKALNYRTCRFEFGAKIRVSIGEPISFDESYYSKPMKVSARDATKVIMRRIAELE